MPRIFTQPVIKLLVLAAVIAGFIIYIRIGARLPPPREDNRVTNRLGGYSIIMPDGWESKIIYGSTSPLYKDTLEIRPKVSKGGFEPRIFIGRYRAQPDFDQIRQRQQSVPGVTIKNYEAQVFTGETKREFYWRAFIHHGGEWYELTLWLPLEQREDIPRSRWWAYLESFAAPDVPPTLPTSTISSGP